MKLKIINRILCISLIFIFTFTTFYSYSKVYGKTYYVNNAAFNDNLIFSASSSPDLCLYARYAAVIDGGNNRLLFGKNEDTKVPMASTTKIMTCIIALENAPENLCCTTSSLASSMPEVKLFAKEGEKFSLIDMLYSLMLKSHNDTAVIIAENVAKYILNEKNKINTSDYSSSDFVKYFVELMNNKAKDLGCTSTYFITPNGLDAKDDNGIHSTTAYDLCKIMAYCINNDRFLNITQTIEYSFNSDKSSYTVTNANTFINMYPNIISGKTGFTCDAGYCYVCAYKDDDRTFICAVLASGWPNNKTYKWKDTKKLLDYARNNYKKTLVLSKDENPDPYIYSYGYEEKYVQPRLNLNENIYYELCENDKVNILYTIYPVLSEIYPGDVIGQVNIFINDNLYESVQLLSDTYIGTPGYIYYIKYCLSRIFS